MNSSLDRKAPEALRDLKGSRSFFRLALATTVEHEYRGEQFGHPSTYAFVRFYCAPSDGLRFESTAAWPSTVSNTEQTLFERAIAEGVADALLSGTYQHSGCVLTLIEIRYDEVCSSEVAFMRATAAAMQVLLGVDWTAIARKNN
jgi:hypothetical protein